MKRPLQVTLIGFLFIGAGAMGVVYHATELKEINEQPDVLLVLIVRMLAILGGVYTLRGANWARWLLLVWITYHVILSYFHSTTELITHIIFLVIIAVALFHPKSNPYFQKK